MTRPLLGVVAMFCLASPSLASAQPAIVVTEQTGVKASVLWVPGIHIINGVFGDDTPRGRTSAGVSLGVRFCAAGDGPVAFVSDATLFPFPIRNPHFGESVHPLHLDLGARFGRGTYFRIGVGFSFHFWSGKSAKDKVSPALTATIAVGHELTAGTTGVAPEIVARASVAPGVGLLSLGAQAAIGTCGR